MKEMTEINATTNMDNKKVSMRPTVDHKFKLMMLGDAGVGKTSIARRFVDDAFLTTYIHTIGIDFLEKMVEVDQKSIKLQIWDTAGQDRCCFTLFIFYPEFYCLVFAPAHLYAGSGPSFDHTTEELQAWFLFMTSLMRRRFTTLKTG